MFDYMKRLAKIDEACMRAVYLTDIFASIVFAASILLSPWSNIHTIAGSLTVALYIVFDASLLWFSFSGKPPTERTMVLKLYLYVQIGIIIGNVVFNLVDAPFWRSELSWLADQTLLFVVCLRRYLTLTAADNMKFETVEAENE